MQTIDLGQYTANVLNFADNIQYIHQFNLNDLNNENNIIQNHSSSNQNKKQLKKYKRYGKTITLFKSNK